MDRLDTLHGRVARVVVIKHNGPSPLLFLNFRLIVNDHDKPPLITMGPPLPSKRKRSIVATFICVDSGTVKFIRDLGEDEKFDVQILRVCDDGPDLRGEVLGCSVLMPEEAAKRKTLTLVADDLVPQDTDEFYNKIDPAGKENRRKTLAIQKAISARRRKRFAEAEEKGNVLQRSGSTPPEPETPPKL